MAPGPIRALRFIHAALRAAAEEIETKSAAFDRPEQVAEIADAVRMFTRATRGHAAGEDAGYFPTLSERAPKVTDTFSFDHRDELQHLAELDRFAGDCTQDELPAFAKLASVVRAQMDLHMKKEEQLLWPLTEELFSPPEQGAIIQAILAAIPKQEMPALIPWLTNQLSDDDAVAYVELLQNVQPAPVFETTVGWIREGIRPELWSTITSRVDSLDA
jgi:iron-sulfur cluster repair protein YtfE (RIC family)